MKWRLLSGVVLALKLVTPAFGYGTTISIGVSYCPATYSSSTTSTSTSSGAFTTPTYVYLEGMALWS
jgi:hypothetical protein